MYRIREVDGQDEDIADELRDLHDACFGNTAPMPSFEYGHWWLASVAKEAVAFAGLKRSARYVNVGYLCRAGVMPAHRGHGLQRRLLKAREARAKRNGWVAVITDTTDNVASANSLVGSGYRMYEPTEPWGMGRSLYWRKWLNTEPWEPSASPLAMEWGRVGIEE